MDVETQIQLLIDNAPQDGVTPTFVAAIAPILNAIAQQLRHLQYYILQNMEQGWVVTTLTNRTNPDIEKRVIYAYPTLQDVSVSATVGLDPQVIAAPIPVTHILFQLMALDTVDSIVFFEHSGNLTSGVEVRRQDLQDLIQQGLAPNTSGSQIPPDIA
jgi:non-ribosomal peptide synthetase component E (peptide arylation enzyme)